MTKDIENQIQLDEELLNLVNIGIWPPKMKLDPIGWIGNFQPDEQKLARRLLKNFLYFSQIMTEEMFKSNFQSLSKYILTDIHKHLHEGQNNGKEVTVLEDMRDHTEQLRKEWNYEQYIG